MKRSTPINVHHLNNFKRLSFSIFSGLVGMLSLTQSTQVPKSINYYLSTFFFSFFFLWRYISISNAIIIAFFIHKDSTLHQYQYAEINNLLQSWDIDQF
jgi:Na+/H+ antiporter NhaC